MKWEGIGEVSWCHCGVNDIIAGVQEMERAREGVTILFNYVWHSAVINFQILEYSGLNLRFQGMKFVWWWVTGPVKEIVKKGIGSRMAWIGLWMV